MAIDALENRYLLVWFDSAEIDSRNNAFLRLRRALEDLNSKSDRDGISIDLWLESPGGDAHAAYKLALLLRETSAKIRVVIPDYAKSAATLLALVGHEIYLSPSAELGPLDGQMPEEGSLSGYISALNIARAADEVARDAVDLVVSGGAQLVNVTGLSRAQTLEAMLSFSAQFSEPLVAQLDPKLVYHAKQMLRVTKRYAERLLHETVDEGHATRIASSLVETFPTHGYAICESEARELGLPIRPLAEYDQLEALRAVHRSWEDDPISLIELASMREALELEETEEDDDQDEDTLDSGEQIDGIEPPELAPEPITISSAQEAGNGAGREQATEPPAT